METRSNDNMQSEVVALLLLCTRISLTKGRLQHQVKKCEGSPQLKYVWGDALTDSPDCMGPNDTPYPMTAVSRSFRGSNPWSGNSRTGRASKPIDPMLTQRALLGMYEKTKEGDFVPSMMGSRMARMANSAQSSSSNQQSQQCPGANSIPQRLCKTRYNTTAPMYGVSLTSGQPVTIVQKFPDLLQQVVFEVCESSECDVVRGECTQTYVPYLFLVIPLGPVTLTGQDYVLVESGCVCRPKPQTTYAPESSPIDALSGVVAPHRP